MPKITASVEMQCNKCRGTVFQMPDGTANDPILVCSKCGNPIGPKSSVEAALRGEGHTPLGGSVVSSFKNLD